MPRMSEDELRAYQQRRQSHDNPERSGPSGDVEQRTGHASTATDEIQTPVQAVDIRFTHYRRRLADPDNFATKHFIDGFVEAGLLPDDSPEFVNEVRHRQLKIASWQQEHMQIELIKLDTTDKA